jgi:hypothetical protein
MCGGRHEPQGLPQVAKVTKHLLTLGILMDVIQDKQNELI